MYRFNTQKLLFLLFSLFATSGVLFAWSPSLEVYNIQNNSNIPVFYTILYKNDFEEDGTYYYEDDVFINMFFAYPGASLQPNLFNGLFRVLRNPQIGILEKFKRLVKEFTVYDADGNVIMTADDIQVGSVIEYENNIKTNDYEVKRKNIYEGNFLIEYYGDINDKNTQTVATIEITNKLVEQGRQKHTASTEAAKLLANRKYTIYLPNGTKIEGFTDGKGKINEQDIPIGDFYIEIYDKE